MAESDNIKSKATKPENINLALAFYGGVSLAVYEAGVADELLRFLQFCREQREQKHDIPDIKLNVIAGSSAGGLAGVMLAAAYINSVDPKDHLHKLRNMWLDVADVSTLQYKSGQDVCSLLNNNILEEKIDDYLKIPPKNAENRKDDVKDITLKITGTNMQGLFDAIPVEDDFVKVDSYAKKTIPTTRYTEAFTFSHVDISDAVTKGDIRKKIAHASRITSSFPVAFPPQNSLSPSFASGTIEDENDKSIHFWYCDGGVMDNKPLGYAIDEIETSAANGEWLFIFIDPQPEEDKTAKDATWNEKEIDPAETVAAFLSIKSSETIYYDLRRVQQLNNQVMQIRGVVCGIWPVLCDSSESTLAAIGKLRKDVAASRMYRFLKDYIKCVTTIRRYSQEPPAKNQLSRINSIQQEITNLIEPLNLIETIDSFIAEIPTVKTELEGILKGLKIHISTEEVSKIIEEYKQLKDSKAADNPFNDYTETVNKIKKAQLRFRRITFWVEDDCNSASKAISAETWVAYNEAIAALSELVKKLSREYNSINKKLLELFNKIHSSPDELYNKFVSYMLLSEAIHAASNVETRQLIDIVRIYHDNNENGRLAGALLAHFSAFLDNGWRKNDYLWGKLDARKALKTKLKKEEIKAEKPEITIYPCFNDEFWREYDSFCDKHEKEDYDEQHRLDETKKLKPDKLELDALPASNVILSVNGILKNAGKLTCKYKNRNFFKMLNSLHVEFFLILLRGAIKLISGITAKSSNLGNFMSQLKRKLGLLIVISGIALYLAPLTVDNFIKLTMKEVHSPYLDYVINHRKFVSVILAALLTILTRMICYIYQRNMKIRK